MKSSSTIGSLTVNGVPVDVSGSVSAGGTVSLPLGTDVIALDLNRTVAGESGVTRQAIHLWLLGTEIVVGEAVDGFSGNPCAQ